ncbi:DUF4352 domain-containing protein [Paratractidigestivibacter faecalis]|uniref:DUF4352 domain-containing protein n=1 Tax=Paratractidigestivibacter faecalis TaxID=2292441 RepID=UPI0018E50C20|nr:DUF4352 domain-containing protein [Paratractidigestivibacter faecalis]
MAKEGKKPMGKIVLIVVVVLVVVGALGSMGGNKTTTTAPESTQQTEQSDAKDQSATEQKTEESTENLVIGTTVNLPDGLSVTVDSVEPGLANYDGSAMTGIHVTYTNNGDDGASYNVFDWKGEDANGAQQSSGYYSDGSDELSSGTLAKGGTVSGNVYFKGDLARVLYFGNVLEKTATASWALS